MRTFTCLVSSLALAALAACSPPPVPVIGAETPLNFDIANEVAGPRISKGPVGRLTMSWMERHDDTATLRFATLADMGFGEPQTVVTDERMFVNWADMPSVMRVEDKHWVAHWLRYSADKTYSYDVVVAQSFDNGATWSDPLVAHTDGTPTEHGFVSMYRAADGVGLAWLDGRATPDNAMRLRTAVISPDNERLHEQRIDESVCDCCQTDMAVSSLGPLVVYRDRTAEEIRDIYIARRTGNSTGDNWEPGERLYADDWEIPGCPVNGPSIVAERDQVAVAWFSAANNHSIVRLVRSADGGRTFGEPLVMAEDQLSGYVGLAQLPDGHLGVSWVARNEEGSNTLLVAVVDPTNRVLETRKVADIAQLRVFPQLGFQDNRLVLAWTDEIEDRRVLRATSFTLTLP